MRVVVENTSDYSPGVFPCSTEPEFCTYLFHCSFAFVCIVCFIHLRYVIIKYLFRTGVPNEVWLI